MLSEVPLGWQQTTIANVASLNDESLSSKTPADYDFRYVSIDDVSTGSINGWTSLTFAEAPSRARRIARRGDILLSTVRPYLKSFTRVDGHDNDLVVSTGFAVLRAGAEINPAYLYQLIFSEPFIEHLKELMTGSNYPAVKPKDIAAFPFALPPLNEQHRIAEILSSVDASIQATQSVIEQAERVKRGLMAELLTGGLGSDAIERGEVPEGWALSPVSSVLKPSLFIDGDWVESKDQSPDGDVRLIQLADIGDGYFIDKSDRHLTKDTAMRLKCTFLRKGDILVARMPEPLGRCCFFPLEGEECFVTVVDVAIMRPHESFNATWLMNLINSDYARRFIEDNAGGTTRKRISRKNLGGLLLPVPPIGEQCRIAEILSDLDSFITKQKKTVEQLTRTKRGLMDDLLTGKVRTV